MSGVCCDSARENYRNRLASPRTLDSEGSLRSSSLTAFAPAVLTSPAFVEREVSPADLL